MIAAELRALQTKKQQPQQHIELATRGAPSTTSSMTFALSAAARRRPKKAAQKQEQRIRDEESTSDNESDDSLSSGQSTPPSQFYGRPGTSALNPTTTAIRADLGSSIQTAGFTPGATS